MIATAVTLGVKLMKKDHKELVIIKRGEEIEFDVLGGYFLSKTKKKGDFI